MKNLNLIRCEIRAGACGLVTRVEAESGDGQKVRLRIESDCGAVEKMGEELEELDAFAACFGPICESPVYRAASRHCPHTACPVPSGIIKAAEVACSLALPADVSITLTKE